MTPTNKLRWLNKFETVEPYEGSGGKRPVRVLQQWWEKSSIGTFDFLCTGETFSFGYVQGEWRDVE